MSTPWRASYLPDVRDELITEQNSLEGRTGLDPAIVRALEEHVMRGGPDVTERERRIVARHAGEPRLPDEDPARRALLGDRADDHPCPRSIRDYAPVRGGPGDALPERADRVRRWPATAPSPRWARRLNPCAPNDLGPWRPPICESITRSTRNDSLRPSGPACSFQVPLGT